MTGNIYIIDEEELLIDAGVPVDARFVLRNLKKTGRRAEDVGHILLTHFHVDHAGTAADNARPDPLR